MGYTKLIQSGHVTEIYTYAQNIHTEGRKPREHGIRHVKGLARRHDNIRRVVKDFRRTVWANLGGNVRPAMLTLTMLEVVSLSQSRRDLHEFLRTLKRRVGYDRHIAAVEWQERGAVHFHCLIWGLPEELQCTYERKGKVSFHTCSQSKKCENATRTIQRIWARGFCDCVATDGRPGLAGYLSKYMSKAMHDNRLGGEKAYSTSRNCMRPMSISGEKVVEYRELIVGDNPPRHEKQYESQWLGRAIYQQYSSNDYEPRRRNEDRD